MGSESLILKHAFKRFWEEKPLRISFSNWYMGIGVRPPCEEEEDLPTMCGEEMSLQIIKQIMMIEYFIYHAKTTELGQLDSP